MDAYQQGSPKVFCGHVTDDGHLNGVAVYPPDVRPFSSGAFLARSSPFDRVISKDICPRFVSARNDLFGHYLKPKGRASWPATAESVTELRKSSQVLFHGSSDGALVRALLDKPSGLLKRIKNAFAAPAAPLPIIPLIGHIDSASGYGIYTVQIALELLKRGYRLEIQSPAWNENGAPLPPEIKSRLVSSIAKHDWQLVIYPCVIQPKGLTLNNPNTAYLTMWESTRLISKVDASRTQALNTMARCKVVMVPNAWNASVFSACGVDTPIRLVPLGTDLSLFPIAPLNVKSNPFVFGTAARTHFGGIRKGFALVVEAFRLAFPKETDVLLRVKCFAEDPPLETHGDKRIEQIRTFIPVSELANWYRSIHVFVSGSASEGWGRHQQEAMCMGRPVVGIDFGGVCEFFNEENGYACDWTLEPGEGIYKSMGHYARPSIESIAAQMRLAYDDRHEVARKSALAIRSARRFSVEHSTDKILATLREFGFLKS